MPPWNPAQTRSADTEKQDAMIDPIYTAEALSTGGGRSGHVRTSDGQLDLKLASPTTMGGSGDGANPESLFAAGYAACFHSALMAAARRQKISVDGSSVGSRVNLHRHEGGFHLSVLLEVNIPGLPTGEAEALAYAAHAVCPYSNALRNNVLVSISVSDD